MKPTRTWTGKWIGRANATLYDATGPVLPAPFFRKTFHLDKIPEISEVFICGLGYYELYLNGKKVGDHVLDPTPTQYEKRVLYVKYDVTACLKKGENALGVVLGNGWYNASTPEVWNFDKASWRDYPKLILDLEIEGKNILHSDASWKSKTGPIVFDALRNGEHYDARLELGEWHSPGYDDKDWECAGAAWPPGGELHLQTMPACKVMSTIAPVQQKILPNGDLVLDFGQNLTGWLRLKVTGEAGTSVAIRYAERLHQDGSIDNEHLKKFILGGEFQTDHYTLKGTPNEIWEPRFTYHGFQYAQITSSQPVAFHSHEARLVHTAFEKVGDFDSSDEMLCRIHRTTLWSYIGNFTGIPTDCPHREKNGWSGDAHLASEAGLFHFDVSSSYAQWMEGFADSQRASGQLPAIVPTSGWGFNWGSGPAWDSAFFLIPWNVYLFTGELAIFKTHFEAMKKYLAYVGAMSENHIASFGLGDWGHDPKRITDPALTSTAFYYSGVLILSQVAGLLGRKKEKRQYAELAARIREAFNRTFYRGEGIYANGEPTALGTALYHGLAEESEKPKIARALAQVVEKNSFKPDFGILGSKCVPRALSEYGYAGHAFRLLTQTDFPGWGHWMNQGANTLWGNWDGKGSRNHIMFGDVSAWMMRYPAGIHPDPKHPGFQHFFVRPQVVGDLSWVKASHVSPFGKISVEWTIQNFPFEIKIHVPRKTSATLTLPGGEVRRLRSGEHMIKTTLTMHPSAENDFQKK